MRDLPPLIGEIKMAKIWISLPITHAGPRHSLATEAIGGFLRTVGTEEVVVVPPNVPFQVEEAEGRYLVALHHGKIVWAHDLRPSIVDAPLPEKEC
jgi:hypothetical protein